MISQKKIKKGNSERTLVLERTEDILGEIGKKKENRVLVGFAAETEDFISNARKKLEEKNLDFIVVNDVTEPGAGFEVDTNRVKILYPSGKVKDLPLMTKEELSQIILDEVVHLLKLKRKLKKR